MALLDKFKKKKISQEKTSQEAVKKASSSGRPDKKEAPADICARAYEFIKEPLITEKTVAMGEKGKYVFKVAFSANKTEVKKAIENLYGVKVEKTAIIHLPAKRRRLGARQGWKGGLKKGYKKAVVTLQEGDSIE